MGSKAPARTTRSAAWLRRLVAIALLAAVVAPAIRNHDSFPLSTYPMYAGTRGDAVRIATAVGIDDLGAPRSLSLRAIAATDDPLIAESLVRRAIADGRADELCAEIAGRVSPTVTRVDVIEERHDVVAKARGDDSLLERDIRASCAVSR